jgi:uncharacterized SAM-binding protein YcdF (DUF218 family)
MGEHWRGRIPTEEEITAINEQHLIRTPIRPADLLFVFGTREDVVQRVAAACRLWREGFFGHAIVSGGVTPGSPLSECEIIKGAMVARGIPSERILEEHRALNTGENVVLSLPVIEAAIGLKNIRSVICLGNTWTARRYPMTLQRHWPEVEKMLITVDSFDTPLSLWHTHPEFRARMIEEWDKIGPYMANGFIAEWPVTPTTERRTWLVPHHQDGALRVAHDMACIRAEKIGAHRRTVRCHDNEVGVHGCGLLQNLMIDAALPHYRGNPGCFNPGFARHDSERFFRSLTLLGVEVGRYVFRQHHRRHRHDVQQANAASVALRQRRGGCNRRFRQIGIGEVDRDQN